MSLQVLQAPAAATTGGIVLSLRAPPTRRVLGSGIVLDVVNTKEAAQSFTIPASQSTCSRIVLDFVNTNKAAQSHTITSSQSTYQLHHQPGQRISLQAPAATIPLRAPSHPVP